MWQNYWLISLMKVTQTLLESWIKVLKILSMTLICLKRHKIQRHQIRRPKSHVTKSDVTKSSSSTSTSSNSKSIKQFIFDLYLVVKNKIWKSRGFMLQWFQFSKAPLFGWTQTHPMLNIIIILVDCDHNILRLNRWLSTETGFSVNRTYFPVAV